MKTQGQKDTATKVADGIYFLHPDGSAWIVARFRRGIHVGGTEQAAAATHLAARDSWAGIVPSDDDEEVWDETAETIIRDVMGDEACPELVVVTLHRR